MTPYLEKLIKLAAKALEEEDLYLRGALTNNQAYSSDKNGLLSINNERYYQFVIARYLFKHFSRKIALESNFIDLVVFSEHDHATYGIAIEMKRWMSSTGNTEISGIQKDIDKLKVVTAEHRLMLVFSSNPKGVSVKGNLDYLSQKIDRNIDPTQWVFESFDTVGNDGKENEFWVAGYEVI